MFFTITLLVSYYIEMLIAYSYYIQIGSRKFSSMFCLVIGAALFFFAAGSNIVVPDNTALNLVIFFLINVAFSIICFNVHPVKAAYSAVILAAVRLSIDTGAVYLMCAITNTTADLYAEKASRFAMSVVLSKAVYFTICNILAGTTKRSGNTVHYPVVLYFFPAAVAAFVLFYWQISVQYNLDFSMNIKMLVLSALFLFLTVVLFLSYQRDVYKENQIAVLKAAMKRGDNEKRYFDILEKQNENLLRYAHDTKNHLSAIKSLNKDEVIDEYLDRMSDCLMKYSNIGHSGNKALDIIINKYSTECDMNGIDFTVDVKLANFSYIDDYDLVTVLSNSLDNALESAKNSKKKRISFVSDYKNTYDIAIITNSCDKPPVSKGKELKTTKANKVSHGLGSKNAIDALIKYNGDWDWSYNDVKREFEVTIAVPHEGSTY